MPDNIMGLENKGYAYIPKECENKECPVHMVYHGCGQSLSQINTTFIEFAGYNQVAEANDVIIVYPQAKPYKDENVNTNGCFDYYGYTNDHGIEEIYVSKDAPQMKATYGILEQLAAGELELTFEFISGPELINKDEDCGKCAAKDKHHVCSYFGAAWCCEEGDTFFFCECNGDELKDLIFCPSSDACDQTEYTFSKDERLFTQNTTEKPDICVYSFGTQDSGTMEIRMEQPLTLFDPGFMRLTCLDYPCNITTELNDDDELYLISNLTKNLEWEAELVKLSEVKLFQGWVIIVFFVLLGGILVLGGMTILIFAKWRKASMSKSRSYGEKQE